MYDVSDFNLPHVHLDNNNTGLSSNGGNLHNIASILNECFASNNNNNNNVIVKTLAFLAHSQSEFKFLIKVFEINIY